MSLTVKTLTPAEYADFGRQVAGLEYGIRYPLGDDHFTIDHGTDYFAFFTRLGELLYDVVLDGDDVVAVAARVLRPARPKTPISAAAKPVWYACDLKVRRSHRGQRITTKLAVHAFARSYARCPRGYAITMNPSDGPNPVVRLVERLPLVPAKASLLSFFSLDADTMADLAPVVEAHRGPLGYLSLRGVKDIVLESTGAPMALLHVQFGPHAARVTAPQHRTDPQPNAVHMLCTPNDDPLTVELIDRGAKTSASATILSHRMPTTEFRHFLTSGI